MMLSISNFTEQIGRAWCRMMHRDPMWPVNGQYRCPDCLRTYDVPWEKKPVTPAHRHTVTEITHARPAAALAPERVA